MCAGGRITQTWASSVQTDLHYEQLFRQNPFLNLSKSGLDTKLQGCACYKLYIQELLVCCQPSSQRLLQAMYLYKSGSESYPEADTYYKI